MGCDPLSSSSVHGISQARILEWVAVSRGSPWPRNQTCSSCIGRYILYHWVTWEPQLLSLLHLYLTCFGVFHLNINKQASNLLSPHPASDISSVQAAVHSRARWEMLSSYLLHFLVSCGLSAPPSRLSPPSSIQAALLRPSVTSTCEIWCQLSSPFPASHLSIFENRCTFSLENFLYWFPVVSHSLGSSSSAFFAESFPYAWHPSVCYKHGLLWALFSQDTYSLFHGNQHHDVKCHLEADDNKGISLQPHSLPHRPELTLLPDWRLHLDVYQHPKFCLEHGSSFLWYHSFSRCHTVRKPKNFVSLLTSVYPIFNS